LRQHRPGRVTQEFAMTIHLHNGDLPDGLSLGPVVAIDTETMGLDPRRDRSVSYGVRPSPSVWQARRL
jgi:hypothetical protein